MLKLYKKINNTLHYWETWDTKVKTGIIHWGIVGSKGEDKEVKSTPLESFKEKIQNEISIKTKEGFAKIDLDAHCTLLIEFPVNGMGELEDFEKKITA